MALVSTQPLIELYQEIFLAGKGGRIGNLTIVMSGNLGVSTPGTKRACPVKGFIYYVEIKCQLDATDDIYSRFYCLLNMFRAIPCPSSGAR